MKKSVSTIFALRSAASGFLVLCVLFGCNDEENSWQFASDEPVELVPDLTELEGRLVFIQGGSNGSYHLFVDNQWIKLKLKDEPQIPLDSTVRVTGQLDASSFSMTVERMTAAAGGDGDGDASENVPMDLSTAADETGAAFPVNHKVAVVVVTDTNLSDDERASADTYGKQVFGVFEDPRFPGVDRSTKAFYNEVSFGKLAIVGGVFTGFETDMHARTCSEGLLKNLLSQAVDFLENEIGFSQYDYDTVIGVYDRKDGLTDCKLPYAAEALATKVGTSIVWSYVNNADVYAHELGHVLGVSHANGKYCRGKRGTVPLSKDCYTVEYDDPYDTMGNLGNNHFSAQRKAAMGWIDETNVEKVTESGIYSLAPQEEPSDRIQSLLIKIPSSIEYYQLELRKSFGFDADPRLDNTVLLRRGDAFGGGQTELFFAQAPYGVDNDGLQVNRPFVDPYTGIAIELLGIDLPDDTTVPPTPQLARIRVTMNGPTCTDGEKNGDETDLNCGGSCDACADGARCNTSLDCESADCIEGVCESSDGGLTAKVFSYGWTAEGPTHVSRAPVVDFEWGIRNPLEKKSTDYAVEWSGSIVPLESDNYTFYVNANNHTVLTIDGQELLNTNTDAVVEHSSAAIPLEAGKAYPVQLRYSEADSPALVQLLWSGDTHPQKEIVPSSRLQPLQGGLTAEYAAAQGEILMSRIDNMVTVAWDRTTVHEQLTWGEHSDGFTVRWTGKLIPRFTESTFFILSTEDNAELRVNGELVVDKKKPAVGVGNIDLIKDIPADIEVALYYPGGRTSASMDLKWYSAHQALESIPDTRLLPTVLGDVNSDSETNIVDALLTAQYYVGMKPPRFNEGAADVNRSGRVDIVDALLMAQKYVGLIEGFTSELHASINASVSPAIQTAPVSLPTACLISMGNFLNPSYLSPTAEEWGDFLKIGDYVFLDQDGIENARQIGGIRDKFYFSQSYTGTTDVYAPCSMYRSGGENRGSILPSGEQYFERGEDHMFSTMPEPGYHLEALIVNGTSLGIRQLDYVFQDLQAAQTIQAVFGEGTVPIYKISVDTAGEGTTSLGGNIRFHEGEDVTVTFAPNAGHRIDSVRIDGVEMGPIAEHTWTGLTADHQIQIAFVPL